MRSAPLVACSFLFFSACLQHSLSAENIVRDPLPGESELLYSDTEYEDAPEVAPEVDADGDTTIPDAEEAPAASVPTSSLVCPHCNKGVGVRLTGW